MALTHLLAHLGTAAFAIAALTAAGIIFVTNVIRIDYEPLVAGLFSPQ